MLARVAYDAGIINAAFYTTLVLAAVLTSQAAGVWLRLVLGRGWPLLSSNPEETWKTVPRLGKQSGELQAFTTQAQREPSPSGIPILPDGHQ